MHNVSGSLLVLWVYSSPLTVILDIMHSMKYELYACLPFVELKVPDVAMGPVHFWPVTHADKFLSPSLIPLLNDYLETVTQVKVCTPNQVINTEKLCCHTMTCISIDPKVQPELREGLLIDAIYLLFFCGAFSHLFASAKAPHFDVFTKILPATSAFLSDKSRWKEAYILEAQRESPVTLERFDREMCKGLGHGLACAYQTDTCRSSADTAKVQSLIRSIRYFVDRFFERFENLINEGLSIPHVVYEAEDIVFLATSFEALFDLNDQHPHIDFKHKLRPMLELRFSTSVELLWQWVDGFFHLREQIVHGRPLPDAIFRANPNFNISYFYLGVKLYLYGVYWRMHHYQLISSRPENFEWVTSEELLAFFCPEDELIRRIHKTVSLLEKDWKESHHLSDFHFLTAIFLHIYDQYFVGPQPARDHASLQWIPAPLSEIKAAADEICQKLEKAPQELSTSRFIHALKQRVSLTEPIVEFFNTDKHR